MPPQPPVVTFVQDDATRPQLASAPMGNSAPKKAQPLTKKQNNQPPNSLRADQPTQRPDQYGQFAQSQLSRYRGSQNKPQGKIPFRLTR